MEISISQYHSTQSNICFIIECIFFTSGDEVFSINGTPVQGMTHAEAIGLFKEVKQGSLIVVLGRRKNQNNQIKKKQVNFEE